MTDTRRSQPLDWEPAPDAQPAVVVRALVGRRKRQLMCAKCGTRPRKPAQRWCRACHAAYMREWRVKAHEELEHLREMAEVFHVNELSDVKQP